MFIDYGPGSFAAVPLLQINLIMTQYSAEKHINTESSTRCQMYPASAHGGAWHITKALPRRRLILNMHRHFAPGAVDIAAGSPITCDLSSVGHAPAAPIMMPKIEQAAQITPSTGKLGGQYLDTNITHKGQLIRAPPWYNAEFLQLTNRQQA